MAEQLGSAVLTVRVDDTQLKAGLQSAQRQAAAAGRSIEQSFSNTGKPLQAAQGIARIGDEAAGAAGGIGALGTGLGGLAGGAAIAGTAVLAVGAAVVGVGAAATQAAGQAQRLNAAFVGLTGSAEAAKQLRQDLFTLSKTTPFKNEDILQAAQRFLAVGVEVDKLQGTINRVGAIAAQSGQPLERLALIYAQVYAKGRLQGEENLQLLEAGVDLTQELSQVTGLSGKALQDAMSKGQIGINTFNQALILATGDMKSLQLAGQAVDVQFNNIGDNIGQVFGGFAQAIAPALSAAFKVVNDIFDQAFPSLEAVTQFFAPLTEGAKEFAAALSGNPELVAALAASFRSLGEVIIGNIGRGLKFISDLLAKTDGKALVNGLLTVEYVLRRGFLQARALGVALAKNAELLGRALSNPAQFTFDIAQAGGFGAFMSQQYKEATDAWTAATSAKPLPFPEIKPGGKQAMQGDLSEKETRQAVTAQQELAANAKLRLADLQRIQGLEGAALQQMQKQLEIDVLRRKERKAIADYDAALAAAGFNKTDPTVQQAESQLVEIRRALIEGSTALRESARDAARELRQASLDLSNARQLAATPTFSTGDPGPARAALQQVQGIRQSIAQARQASADAARQAAQAFNNGLQGDALQVLIDTARAAGERLKGALVSGADALRLASSQAAEALKQSRLQLASIVADPQGLNELLSPQLGQERTQQALQSILPLFRAAQSAFERLTGVQAPDFTGPAQGVLSAVQDFISRVDREQRAQEAVQLNGRSLEVINEALAVATNQLATATRELAAKNWNVNVSVPGGTATGDVIGAVNGAF